MERVAFLIEKTGERIGCMLNPETLVARRSAGVLRRNSISGPLQATRLTDDPLLYTGGGATELNLDLLFDTTLAGGTEEPLDVRSLTRPLWNLTENSGDDGDGQLPIVRFVWGKTWNIPGIIAAIAERLEFFSEAGIPRRSWLRMRFCRVNLDKQVEPSAPPAPDLDGLLPPEDFPASGAVEVAGGEPPEDNGSSASTPTRLDEIAYRVCGNPAMWRILAWFNKIDDPLRIESGTLLRMPQLESVQNAAVKESA